MCFIVSVISLAAAYSFFVHSNMLLATISVLFAMFFIYLMIKNIINVKNIKSKNNDN
jgi:hypothetical protein